MATAGMGDILSGIIGGLLAQHVPLVIAAKLGVLLHGLAGDYAAEEGERGMIASDLLPYLRFLVNP
jgi:NAD(P)H-hydrate epimerase